jgi:hypothetical protein
MRWLAIVRRISLARRFHPATGGLLMSLETDAYQRNIDNFHSRLLMEEHTDIRNVLLRLLIEEENKYGGRCERIDIVKSKIEKGRTLIEKQKCIVDRLIKEKGNLVYANRILKNFIETQDILLQHLAVLEK